MFDDEGFERVACYHTVIFVYADQARYYITKAYLSVHVSCCDLL